MMPPLEISDLTIDCDVVSPRIVIVLDGQALRATDDGARTWRTSRFNTGDLSENSVRINFVDANHGWIVVAKPSTSENDYGDCYIYRTANGGKTWWPVPIRITQ